jgi:DNA polymerase I-like protein with 3'-5' exonuclease and polymerase domains
LSRYDLSGLFWTDIARESTRGVRSEVARSLAPIPDTGWKAPTEFPNLSGARCIALDTETYDPELLDKGPGWARHVGHIVGVSLAVDGGAWYFPMRHTVEPEKNLDPDNVLAFLRDTLGNAAQPKVGANLQYDAGWLREEGVDVRGPLIDVQTMQALLDESSEVNLEFLSQLYLGLGKESPQLYQWCSDSYGGKANGKQRANIYRAPVSLVGPYAESDAALPLALAKHMYPLMEKEGLLRVFDVETRLTPLLLDMRFAGVTIDVSKAEKLREDLRERESLTLSQLKAMTGLDVNVNAAESIARAFDKLGIDYPRSESKGAPSFRKEWLLQHPHPVAQLISRVRNLAKLRGTFIESYLLGNHINNKVYGQFHAVRGDTNGTRSGRLSSSNPNLQNIPARDDEIAPLIRGVFTPDDGHSTWARFDYSQIEYRFLLHYAVGPGAHETRAYFNANPETDFHERALDLVAPVANWDISTKEMRKARRKPVKNINFGLVYGMSEATLAGHLGLSMNEAKALFQAYHTAMPYVKPTMQAAMREAQSGKVSTILGRLSRFDLFEPATHYDKPLPLAQAVKEYGNHLQRGHSHKGLNRKLQGSAADLMKVAMVECYERGLFKETGVPRLSVHDELDFSCPGDDMRPLYAIKKCLEESMKLGVPILADLEVGTNWGNVA